MARPAFDVFNPSEEHRHLRESAEKFGASALEPQAAEADCSGNFNTDLFRRLGAELGFFGLTVDHDHGGSGLDATAAVIVHEEMSRFDPAFTLSYLAHEVLFVNNFFHCSNAFQQDRYLQKVLSGEWIAGMAMTEPSAGTDVLGMRSTAIRKGDRFILNGEKQFITNGPTGQVFLVYAKTDPKKRDISAFVVESCWKGFSVGKKESKMGMRSSPTSCLVFEDIEIPAENLLGDEGGALLHMMRNLEIERLSLAAQALGIARRCCEVMNKYAIAERSAFGKKLVEFGQIQRLIAESHAQTEAARALVYTVALRVDPDSRESLAAASAKLVATTTAEHVARNAIQVLGGYGYTEDYPVERLLRDAILLSIGGGTNEAMQKNIARDLMRIHG